MKIACQSCQAKYTIADEKVVGKVVKIRCKKCSATIVINGNEAQAAGPEGGGVYDYTAQGSADQWTVNVADGDQRTMTVVEIAKEFRSGVVTDETYCWKDGMADWLPLREIEQLYAACNMGPRPSLEDAMPMSIPPPSGFGSGGSDAPTAERGHANGNGANGGPSLFGNDNSPSPAPAAARRVGGRGGGGADLFGGVAQAGGEDDVMTSTAAAGARGGGGGGGGGATAEEPKLTGQRNENSVLFSLSALTSSDKGAPPPPSKDRTTAQADGSGLIDIRALGATMNQDHGKKNHVDDIMNLSGGGAFGAALAAPILAPPPMPDLGQGGDAQQKGGNKTMIFAILGGFFILAVAIVVVAIVLKGPSDKVASTNTGPTPSVSVAMVDTANMNGGTTGTGATPTTPSTATSAAGTTATPPPAETTQTAAPPGQQTVKATPATQPKSYGGGNTSAPPPKNNENGASAPPPPPPKANGGGDINSAIAAAAGNPAPPPPAQQTASDQPFDRGAAAAALNGVNVQGCKKPDGPTGSGHVSITFATNGSVQAAVVDQPPFAGTPVGGCIAGKFRSAHVPAFSGSAVHAGKSFNIN